MSSNSESTPEEADVSSPVATNTSEQQPTETERPADTPSPISTPEPSEPTIPKIMITEVGNDAEARSLPQSPAEPESATPETLERAPVVLSDPPENMEGQYDPVASSESPSLVPLSAVGKFYRGKTILLTGVTGFIGKAVLWKLIQSFGLHVDKIYLLIRNGSNKRSKIGRPSDRIKSEILNNKAFLSLRRSMGETTFDAIFQEKIVPVAGDIISPDLSLSDQDRDLITKSVQVVIHCAATSDCHERLDLALETNTLGTLRLMDLADTCENMQAFVHMSLSYFNANIPDGHIQERVYPMELGDPEELLKEIVGLELQDIPKMTQRILAVYPNTYTFTKFLTEHLILKRVDYNRIEEAQGGKKQWPIAIVRATQVGAGCSEPLPGWVDGVTGMNAAVFLIGHGVQVLPSDIGRLPADIIPVDYLARIVIASAAEIKPPGTRFLLPYNEIINEEEELASPLPQPIVPCFPVIYQVSGSSLMMGTWSEIYDGIRHYWTRNTKVSLQSAQDYFVNNKALLKARLFLKSQLTPSLASVTTAISGNNSQYGNRSASRPTNRTIEMATRIVEAHQPFLRHRWIFDHQNVRGITLQLENDPQLKLSQFQRIDWTRYMVNYSFGVHVLIAQGPLGLRNIAVPTGWDCALYSKHSVIRDSIIEKQIGSTVFSASDIQKRTERMLAQLIHTLETPGGFERRDKKKEEEWIADFDASLDDWCHDDSELLRDAKTAAVLGRWSTQLGEHDEATKVVVLNDKRVVESVRQIIESSGVPQQTVIGEALRILQRMRERTQLAYVWFAGSFLDALFKRLFSSVRIHEESMLKLKRHIEGKNVIYVPESKTMLDQLLVWYICLRYHLPVPAIICDEALALLGPVSDILRIAGSYFVRRDPTTRSPLNTAVTAAYTEALLHEHGALSMLIEKARSRTGRLQTAFDDGVLDMVVKASLEQHQPAAPDIQDASGNRKDTVIVPLNITYEKIPELRILIDQVLDQKQPRNEPKETQEAAAPKQLSGLARSASFLRPSASVAGRAANKDNSVNEKGKYGRVYVGIGDVVDIRKEAQRNTDSETPLTNIIYKKIQLNQHLSGAATPVALVAAAVLFGRMSGSITMGSIYEQVAWLKGLLELKQIPIDWQDGEDVDAMVAYALNLLDAKKNIIIDGKRVTEYSNVRVVEHADNVMTLSYMANQLVELLLPEALFSISYLSCQSDIIERQELYDSFSFLIDLFNGEFVYLWEKEEKFDQLFEWFVGKGILTCQGGSLVKREAESGFTTYTHICFLASLLYPTLDAYWITSCSLSALRDLPFLPRKIVPLLAQWIAAHLISGRRTIYREVLSTEASQNAVDNFLSIGLITAVHPKTKLSPDAQILLLELGVTTNEDLVMVSSRDKEDQENTSNARRAADIATLCSKIEKHRFGANAQTEAYRHTAQVFDKCQNQIRTILRAEKSYATQHGMQLPKDEDQMIQLVYSLKSASGGASIGNPRRVSEVYNLSKP